MPALCLIGILTLQAVLSLRLVWNNSAYIDEATYLWAGHLEIAHWLHGSTLPLFQTWLSGAPVIYPPIAAIADHVGGLTGARILSLGFMIGSTALLWNLTSRLFGRRAAFFAAALFAVLGPTQFLGALATYDAMALFLIATSAWCVVAARDRCDSSLLLVAGTAVLALANATKYATALFDPVIIVLAALVIADKRSGKAALGRAGYLAAFVIALIAALLAFGGPFYMAGVMYTTLARATGNNSPLLVLEDSWKWAGTVAVLAWIGVVICARRDGRGQAAVLAILAAAGLLAPLEQARIHTITSLHKHVDFGAWLAAPAAGYALAQLSRIGKHKRLSFAVAGLMASAIMPAGALGSVQATDLFRQWPDSSVLIAQLRSLTRSYPGDYLAEDYDIPAYYLAGIVSWSRWSNTWYLSYTRPGTRRALTGAAAYEAAITQRHFSLVILDFLATPRTDSQIVAAMQQVGGYQVVAVVPSSLGQYTIWAHDPAQRSERPHGHH
jgi:4-amino-4-deoxy-L-arabinose transferase-like glycosyltransferase